MIETGNNIFNIDSLRLGSDSTQVSFKLNYLSVKWKLEKFKLADEEVCVVQVQVEMVLRAIEDVRLVQHLCSSD